MAQQDHCPVAMRPPGPHIPSRQGAMLPPPLPHTMGSLNIKTKGCGGGEEGQGHPPVPPHWATRHGDNRPLSAAVLALLQQLDDLGNALLRDLPGGERGCQPHGDTPRAVDPRGGGSGAHQGVIEVEGADVVRGDVSSGQRLRDLRHDAALIWAGKGPP